MSHQIHQTQGIIIGSFDTGEADKVFEVLTKEFGYIKIKAISVRENKSKLRFLLQEFNFLDLGLVFGRNSIRAVEAQKIKDFSDLLKDEHKRSLLSKIIFLTKKFLTASEQNQILFIDFLSSLRFLSENNLNYEQLKSLEVLTVSRFLYHLGYFDNDKKSDFLISEDLNKKTLAKVGRLRSFLTQKINQGIKESQL